MKLYGGRFLRNSVNKSVSRKTESRDAEVYDIDMQSRKCRVKIQGTATLVIVYYPENWESIPAWLKPGNSVRISHTGGDRGRLELVGHGALVVSPVAGDVGAPVRSSTKALLSGLRFVLTTEPSRNILVSVGTFRYNEVVYTVPPITMANGASYKMGAGGKMGEVAAAFDCGSYPPSGQYFYRRIEVGTDLVVDLHSGDVAAIPVMPTLAGDHVGSDWLLIDGSFSSLSKNLDSSHINATWFNRVLTAVRMTPSDDSLAWGETSSTLAITMIDQFGELISPPAGPGWCIKVEFLSGGGKVTEPGGAGTSLPGTKSISAYATGSSINFTYTRETPATDTSPMLQVTILDYGYTDVKFITLLDSGGNVM